MKKERFSIPAIGGSSLLVVFAVLCLVIFSLLSVSTVLAEQRISEAALRTTTDWYAADLEAQTIFAQLRNGQQVPGVEQNGQIYGYSVPISEHQTLFVTLKETESGWEILSWQAKAHPEDGETTLPVWQGLKEE